MNGIVADKSRSVIVAKVYWLENSAIVYRKQKKPKEYALKLIVWRITNI